MDTVPKPDELLALHTVTEELFETLRRWFEVPPAVALDLEDVDSAVAELGDPRMIAATAMRKLQALRLLATPGVKTSTDVVVSIVQDLNRALLQAPAMRLKRAAAVTDWDAEFADLLTSDDPVAAAGTGPADADVPDAEAQRFRQLHAQLHQAVRAVLQASEGEIRYLE